MLYNIKRSFVFWTILLVLIMLVGICYVPMVSSETNNVIGVEQVNVKHSFFFVDGDIEIDCGGLGYINYIKLGEHKYLVNFFCDRGYFRISGICISPPLGGFGMDSYSWGFCKCFYGTLVLDGIIVDLGVLGFNMWGSFSWCRFIIET